MMHLADQAAWEEVVVETSSDGRVYIGPPGKPGDRQISRAFLQRWHAGDEMGRPRRCDTKWCSSDGWTVISMKSDGLRIYLPSNEEESLGRAVPPSKFPPVASEGARGSTACRLWPHRRGLWMVMVEAPTCTPRSIAGGGTPERRGERRLRVLCLSPRGPPWSEPACLSCRKTTSAVQVTR